MTGRAWLASARRTSARVPALLLALAALPGLAPAQTLVHRYSFVSDARDSVGTANGTLVAPKTGAAATISNGLTLPGAGGGYGTAGYVSLPGGLLTNTASITVEAWFTQNSTTGWAELWDFGNSGSQNFALIPYPLNNANNMEVAFTPNGGEVDLQSALRVPTGTQQYVAVTFNSSTLVGNLYDNGVLLATHTYPNATYTPGKIGGANGTAQNMIGNDVYGDAQFSGTVYELRIWNGVVSQRYLAATALTPPGTLITNLTPTSATLTAGPAVVITGTEPGMVNVTLPQTGATPLTATLDATNWVSSNPAVLSVNSGGLITGVGVGTATIRATVGGINATSGPITVSPQYLQNRYRFIADATDSVSGANGTLVAPTTGNPATIANGLTLPGAGGGFGTAGYVSLPAGILTNTTSLTVECWLTQNAATTWAEVWDFGNSGSQNFALITKPGNNNGRVEVAFTPNGGEVDLQSAYLFPNSAQQYLTVTYNNSSLVGNLYANGALIASHTYPSTAYCPGGIGGVNGTTENMIGNDVYGDAQFNGTINEFRIWNGALSPVYVAAGAVAGPATVITNTSIQTLSVTLATNSMVGSQTQQATVTGSVPQASGVVLTGIATYTSSNTNIVTVNAAGLITAVNGGTATITASVGGVNATSAVITVQATPPAITQAPVNQTGILGESVSFGVVAVGGQLTYQWSFAGTPIAGATNAGVTLTNLAATNAGSYSITVANNLGTATKSATLNIVPAVLLHRYSFVSDATDSVGGANGVVVPSTVGGPALSIANGLNLPGNPGGGFGVADYVALPGGLLTNTSSLTVECWVTQNSPNTWAEIWDFGNNGSQNFGFIPFPGNNSHNAEVAFTPNGGELDLASGYNFPSGVEQYVVVTFNAATLVGNFYVNGNLISTRVYPNANYTPGLIGAPFGTGENMLGNDVYGDAQFSGTIYELRIWNGVVPQQYIAASALTDPAIVLTNLTPSAATLTAGPAIVVTGTEQADIMIELAQTGMNLLDATLDATNWVSSNPAVLTVNNSGLITGVSVGTATVSATVDGITSTSGPITVGPQYLQNRYRFVNDASDSVGGQDGTLVPPTTGNPATIANGLYLPGNPAGGNGVAGYVSLPAGLLTPTTSLTVECWFTQNTQNTWAELWDFANNTAQNFALIPYPGNNNGLAEVAFTPNGGELDLQTTYSFPTNGPQYVTVTYNNSSATANLYNNGVLLATRSFPGTGYCPGAIGGLNGTTVNAIGNDIYGDQQFSGTVYEFRVWNGAVSPAYVAVSAAAGPAVVVTNTTPQTLAVTVTTAMVVGQTQAAGVTGSFLQATDVSLTGAADAWHSSNAAVLAVDTNGVITAVGTGTATISATVNGVTATSAAITVTPNLLTVLPTAGGLTLNWVSGSGVLLQAPTLTGPWTTNSAAVPPYSVTPTPGGNQFFRLQLNH